MKEIKLYRQGDVLIERIAEIPQQAKILPRENGRVILAHGEVTGHMHAFSSTDAEKFSDGEGGEYFKVKGKKLDIKLPIKRHWKNQVMVNHPKFGLIEFNDNDVVIEGNEVVVSGNFGLLKHDEHTAQGIPAGLYKGIIQSEYSPEEIRNVAD